MSSLLPVGFLFAVACLIASIVVALFWARPEWRRCPNCDAGVDWTRQGIAGWFGKPWKCHSCGLKLERSPLFTIGCIGTVLSPGLAVGGLVLESYPLMKGGLLLQLAAALLLLCGQRLRLRYRNDLCPSCGYDLRGSVGGVCPECGRGG